MPSFVLLNQNTTLKLVESGLGLSSGMIWGMDLHVCGLSRHVYTKFASFLHTQGWNCCIRMSKVEIYTLINGCVWNFGFMLIFHGLELLKICFVLCFYNV